MAISERDRLRLLEGLRGTLDDEQLATMSELVHNMSPDLTTRQDLSAELSLVRGDLSLLGSELRTEMAELRGELRGEMAELKTELRGEMAELRSELRTEMAQLRGELHREMARSTRLFVATQITTTLILIGFILRLT